MFKKIALSAVAAATAMTVIPAAADARPHYGYSNYGRDHYRGYDGYRGYDNYRGGYYGRSYGGYYSPRSYGSRYYGGRHYRGRCGSGTTGTVLGAIAGGLLGHEIADGGRYRRGDGTAGAIIGGAAGALIGREIDRSC